MSRKIYGEVMKFRCSLLSLFMVCFASVSLAQHQHHGGEGVPADALFKLGTVHFPISCSTSAQAPFERGVAMLHSFWYEEAHKEFESVTQTDPLCAMGWWGVAMTEWRPFWDGMPEDRRRAGMGEIDKAMKLPVKTDRERRYIAALNGYLYSDPAQNAAAVSIYAREMGALSAAYPDDVEAQAFYGLGLAAAASLDQNDPASRPILTIQASRITSSIRAITRSLRAKDCRRLRSMRPLRLLRPMRCICRDIFLRGSVCGRRTLQRIWIR
jgi:hypothetical protein